MIKKLLLSTSAALLLTSLLQAESIVYDELMSVGTYNVMGSFGSYDFAPKGDNGAFDWAFTTTTGAVYQLQGKEPTATDVFGWNPVEIEAPQASWLMFPIGDTDGDGKKTFDWVMVQPQNNGAVYKLAGVNNGTFAYSDRINIPYRVEGNTVLFGESQSSGTDTPSQVDSTYKFTQDYLNGKTLTFLAYDDHGTDNFRWRYVDYTFSGSKLTLSKVEDEADEEAFSIQTSYSVTDDGKIRYTIKHGEESDVQTNYITAFSQEDDYFKVCEAHEGDSCDILEQLFYFDHSKAVAEMQRRNTQTVSKNLVTGQWYQVAVDQSQQHCEMSLSLDNNGEGSLSYINEENNKRETADVSYNIDGDKEFTLSVPSFGESQTYTFITEESDATLNWLKGSRSYDPSDNGLIRWFKSINAVTDFLISQGHSNPQECTKWF